MKMDLKRCFTTHVLLHNLFGIGLGLVLVGLFKGLAASALMLGVVLVVIALGADMMAGGK